MHCWANWAIVASIALQLSVADASDWTRFRGPNGSGLSPDTAPLPTDWSPGRNLKWKVALPGPGASSPVVMGEKVFVTCWSGYGEDRTDPGQMENLRRHVVCLNRHTGKILWSREVAPVLPEDRFGGMFAENGYASHTPTTDGENLYVFFGKTGALAFDLNGNKLWQKSIGTESDRRGWGSASSPILYKDLLIVTAPAESEALIALNKKTGEEVWRKEAGGFASTWGTPILVEADGHTELVLAVPGEIWGFNPETGKLLWYCETAPSDSYCASVVTDGQGMIYALETRGGETTAVRAGGHGDATSTQTVWHGRENARITTPVIVDGRIYLFAGGIASCVDAKTGNRIYQARMTSSSGASAADTERPEPPGRRGPDELGGRPGGGRPGGFGGRGGGGMGGQNYASPIVADGKIYFITRSGEMHVIKPGPTFEQLAVNRVTTDPEDFSATPAVVDGALLIRSSRYLYCVALD